MIEPIDPHQLAEAVHAWPAARSWDVIKKATQTVLTARGILWCRNHEATGYDDGICMYEGEWGTADPEDCDLVKVVIVPVTRFLGDKS